MQRPTPEFMRENYPIVKVRFHPNGLEIVRAESENSSRPRGKRGHIEELSKSSLSKLAFSAQNSRVKFTSMLCLSCGLIYPKSGIIFKMAMNRLLSAMRYKFAPLDYLWFLEFQKRGAPHAHIMTSVTSPTMSDREWLARRWASSLLEHAVLLRSYDPEDLEIARRKMVRQHRRAKTWEKIRSKGGAARYVTKYATKTEQKAVPKDFANVGRFWSMSSDARPKHTSANLTTEEEVRIHLRGKNHPVADWEVIPKLVWYHNGSETDVGQG